MKELFPDFYQLTEEEFRLGWEKALFVLDANVLLDLYRYPEEARKELIGIFEKIADRLWIPYYVALEYQRNRLNTISSQKETFDEVRKIIETGIKNIKGEEININKKLRGLNLEKRHSSISVETFIKSLEESFDKINSASKKFLDELAIKKDEQLSVVDADPIRAKIDELLAGRIGNPPNNQESLNEIYKECQSRVDRSMPPGLIDYRTKKDESDESFYYQGIEYHRKYGDIVIWLNILEKCQEHESVIFINSEKKDDWWWSFQPKNEAPKTMGAKQELLQEVKVKSKVNFFWMYKTEQFIKFAKKYLEAQISEESVAQISDINAINTDVKQVSLAYLFNNHMNENIISIIGQLNSSYLEERLDAVFRLEYLLRKTASISVNDSKFIIEALASFIRKNPSSLKNQERFNVKKDIQVALRVIGQHLYDYEQDDIMINLSNAKIGNVELVKANFSKADFSLTDLTRANFYGANFKAAILYKANLSEAILTSIDFSGVNLTLSTLIGANLQGANLTRANLDGANLTGACLMEANLTGSNLYGAIFNGANFNGANLEDIDPMFLENIKLNTRE